MSEQKKELKESKEMPDLDIGISQQEKIRLFMRQHALLTRSPSMFFPRAKDEEITNNDVEQERSELVSSIETAQTNKSGAGK